MHDRATSETKPRAVATIALAVVLVVAGAALTADTVAAGTVAARTPWLLLPT